MQIINTDPPKWILEECNKKFFVTKHTVFAYGDTIFNPGNNIISEDVIIHENIHSKQQKDNPDSWWKLYLSDQSFRLSQEIEAYREQYKFYCSLYKDKNIRFRFLHIIAADLSGPLYGRLISYTEAIKRIR